jgi:hypothetical protein
VCVRLVRFGSDHHCCRDEAASQHAPLIPPRPSTPTGEHVVIQSERAIARLSRREAARRRAARG